MLGPTQKQDSTNIDQLRHDEVIENNKMEFELGSVVWKSVLNTSPGNCPQASLPELEQGLPERREDRCVKKQEKGFIKNNTT